MMTAFYVNIVIVSLETFFILTEILERVRMVRTAQQWLGLWRHYVAN